MKKILAMVLALAMVLTACVSLTVSASAEGGQVYFLNQKPEADEAWKALAATYTEQTGAYGCYFIADNKFWYAEEEITVGPFRAWFKGSLPSGAKSLSIIVSEDDEATAIGRLEDGNLLLGDGKYLDHGRIVIVKSGRKYNVNGQALK